MRRALHWIWRLGSFKLQGGSAQRSGTSSRTPRRDRSQLAAAALTVLLFSVAIAQAPVAKPRQIAVSSPRVVRALPQAIVALRKGEKLDLNVATAEDLQLLPRIGPSLAARIVEARDSGGHFHNVDELIRIRGIGPRTLAQLRPLVYVGDADGAGEDLSSPEGSESLQQPIAEKGVPAMDQE